MGVRKTKDWSLAGHLFTVDIPRELEIAVKDVIMENAKRYQEAVVNMIESQDGGWRELTEDWLQRKDKLGGSEDIYRFKDEFLDYLKSDRAFQFVKGKFAGAKVVYGARNQIGASNGMNMEQWAYVLQYDYDRPLFQPAFARIESDLVSHWEDIATRGFKGVL